MFYSKTAKIFLCGFCFFAALLAAFYLSAKPPLAVALGDEPTFTATFNVIDAYAQSPAKAVFMAVKVKGYTSVIKKCFTEANGACSVELAKGEYEAAVQDSFYNCILPADCKQTFSLSSQNITLSFSAAKKNITADYCDDSDDGKKYDTRGAAKGKGGTFIDYCGDDYKTLYEGYCSAGFIESEPYKCSYGCQDGACLKGPADCAGMYGAEYQCGSLSEWQSVCAGRGEVKKLRDGNYCIVPGLGSISGRRDSCRTCGKAACIDSDNGKDFYALGTTTMIRPDFAITRTDICYKNPVTSADMLAEYYCSGNLQDYVPAMEYYKCSQGCKDGKCACNCPTTGEPVCAKDGKTYNSACWAACYGAAVDYQGQCKAAEPKEAPKECADCGKGIINACDKKECFVLGSCAFYEGILGSISGMCLAKCAKDVNCSAYKCNTDESAVCAQSTGKCFCQQDTFKEPPCNSYGDVDESGKITQKDIDLLEKYLRGAAELVKRQLNRADVDRDLIVSSNDLKLIENYFGSKISTLPVCQPKVLCKETDDGRDYGNYGQTTDTSRTYKDACAKDGKTLTEYYCFSDEVKSANYECTYGCSGGKCLEKKNCNDCPTNYDPVCGDNNRTFDNSCSAECLYIKIAYKGECKKTPPANCGCPTNYAPVCGADGKTYDNECLAECAKVSVVYRNECPDTGIPGGGGGQGTTTPATTTQKCVDTDNGKTPAVSGTTTGFYSLTGYTADYKWQAVADYCDSNDSRILYEHYCISSDNSAAKEKVQCGYRCENGACVQAPPPAPRCQDCHEGILNYCDKKECLSLGNCAFYKKLFGGECLSKCQQNNDCGKHECDADTAPFCDASAGECKCKAVEPAKTFINCSKVYGKQYWCSSYEQWEKECLGRGSFIELKEGSYCLGTVNQLEENFCATCGEQAVVPCADTDQGKDYYTAGTATDATGKYTDVCFIAQDKPTLKEFFCEGNTAGLTEFSCPFGCVSGACRTAEPPPPKPECQQDTDCVGKISCKINEISVCNIAVNKCECKEKIIAKVEVILFARDSQTQLEINGANFEFFDAAQKIGSCTTTDNLGCSIKIELKKEYIFNVSAAGYVPLKNQPLYISEAYTIPKRLAIMEKEKAKPDITWVIFTVQDEIGNLIPEATVELSSADPADRTGLKRTCLANSNGVCSLGFSSESYPVNAMYKAIASKEGYHWNTEPFVFTPLRLTSVTLILNRGEIKVFGIKLFKGTNFISSPVNQPLTFQEVDNFCDIAPKVTGFSAYFPSSGKWDVAQQVKYGEGALVFLSSDCSFNKTGNMPIPEKRYLQKGWNLIALPVSVSQMSAVQGTCKFKSKFWESESEAVGSALQPFYGYFVEAEQGCWLIY